MELSRSSVETAYFAGGCFWGVEHMMKKLPGIKSITCGFMGGFKENPSYKEVRTGTTGHAEVVKIEFDPSEVDYEDLAKRFFEIIDTSTVDQQGPDVGNQYRSVVFYESLQQKEIAEKLIDILEKKGYEVVTEVLPSSVFYEAEDYHQNYYERNGSEPYCHMWQKKFD